MNNYEIVAITTPTVTVNLCNTTPHPITFGYENEEGELVKVTVNGAPKELLINAKAVETIVGEVVLGVNAVKTVFEPNEEGKLLLTKIPEGVIIVGSIIAAQAYPGKVVAMTPYPGFERVAPAEKVMNLTKFTVY